MTKQLVIPERRDVQRMFELALHNNNFADIKVSVVYLVNFAVDEENFVNTIIDPTVGLPRFKAKKLAEEVIKKLQEQDKDEAPSIIAAPTAAETKQMAGV